MPTLGRIKWRRCESRESSLRYVKRRVETASSAACSRKSSALWRPTVAETGGGWRGGNVPWGADRHRVERAR